MSIPKKSLSQINADDLVYREKDPDTIDVQFQEDTPVTKLLYTFRPEELGVIQKLNFAVGPNDNSVNGFGYLMLTRIKNPSFYTTDFGQNQVMWRKICGDKYVEGSDSFFNEPLYMQKGEEFYLYLASNYPAPTKIFGSLTFYVLPTSR
jgi:hypothetical protein